MVIGHIFVTMFGMYAISNDEFNQFVDQNQQFSGIRQLLTIMAWVRLAIYILLLSCCCCCLCAVCCIVGAGQQQVIQQRRE